MRRRPTRGRPRKPEGEIAFRSDGRRTYRIRWYDGAGKRREATGATEAIARSRWLEARDRLGSPAKVAVDRSAWKNARGWLTHWVYAEPHPEWRGSTYRRHYYYLTAYILNRPQVWRGVQTADLDRDHITEVISRPRSKSEAQLSQSGKRNLVASISAALTAAVARKLLDRNPCTRYVVKSEKPTRDERIVEPRYTTAFVNLAMVIDPATGQRRFPLGDVLAFLLLTGARQGEIRAARWHQWGFTPPWRGERPGETDEEELERRQRELVVDASLSSCRKDYQPGASEEKVTDCVVRGATKSGKPRTLLLNDAARDILINRWKKVQMENGRFPSDSPIFPAPKGGFLGARALSETLRAIQAHESTLYSEGTTVRVAPSHVHSLRKSAATRLIQHGGAIPSVAATLGHQDGGRLLFEVYSKVPPEGAEKLLAQENAALTAAVAENEEIEAQIAAHEERYDPHAGDY